MIPLHERTVLGDEDRLGLERSVRPLSTLEAVLRWGFAQRPAATVAEVVVQDEFTHDVVLSWRPEHWLVFGTT
jgi:hypothetical protein